MYPVGPSTVVLDSTLARTGFPLASLLFVASVLILAGMLLMRSSQLAKAAAEQS